MKLPGMDDLSPQITVTLRAQTNGHFKKIEESFDCLFTQTRITGSSPDGSIREEAASPSAQRVRGPFLLSDWQVKVTHTNDTHSTNLYF